VASSALRKVVASNDPDASKDEVSRVQQALAYVGRVGKLAAAPLWRQGRLKDTADDYR
jgi:hypothetical protein